MSEKIEDKITKKYMGEDGTWLVEKGKLTEAKYLKEAVGTLKFLRKESATHWQLYRESVAKTADIISEYENKNKALEIRLQHIVGRLESLKKSVDQNIEKINEL